MPGAGVPSGGPAVPACPLPRAHTRMCAPPPKTKQKQLPRGCRPLLLPRCLALGRCLWRLLQRRAGEAAAGQPAAVPQPRVVRSQGAGGGVCVDVCAWAFSGGVACMRTMLLARKPFRGEILNRRFPCSLAGTAAPSAPRPPQPPPPLPRLVPPAGSPAGVATRSSWTRTPARGCLSAHGPAAQCYLIRTCCTA